MREARCSMRRALWFAKVAAASQFHGSEGHAVIAPEGMHGALAQDLGDLCELTTASHLLACGMLRVLAAAMTAAREQLP
jgi:hypothetical protein